MYLLQVYYVVQLGPNNMQAPARIWTLTHARGFTKPNLTYVAIPTSLRRHVNGTVATVVSIPGILHNFQKRILWRNKL